MTTALLDELRTLIERHAGLDTKPLRQISGRLLGIESGPTPPCQIVVEPVFSPIAQGATGIEVGQRTFSGSS